MDGIYAPLLKKAAPAPPVPPPTATLLSLSAQDAAKAGSRQSRRRTALFIRNSFMV
jgi:hypothetical protein